MNEGVVLPGRLGAKPRTPGATYVETRTFTTADAPRETTPTEVCQ